MERIAALACIAFLMAAPAAAARGAVAPVAPEYNSSEPADGEKLHEAPDTVTATFSEPLDPGSEMAVEDDCGNKLDDDNVEVSVNEMSVGISKKPSGRYIVRYSARGLGGATGTTEGRFTFEVHAGKPCDGNGGGHGGHGGGGRGGHGGRTDGGHDGHGDGGDQPGMGQHSGNHTGDMDQPSSHDAGSTSHTGHDAGGGDDQGKGHASHAAGTSDRRDERELRSVAAGETPLPDLSPDSTAVFLALLICAAFGGLGGWLLRVSAQK